MGAIRVWQRADGWTEIEGPNIMRRYKHPQEVEAFLEGLNAGQNLAVSAVQAIKVQDDRPVEVVPPERRL